MYAVTAALMWSTVATAFKLTLATTTPIALVAVGNAFAALFLLLTLSLSGKARPLTGMGVSDWLRSGAQGALSPCLYYWILFEAYARLPAQIAQPLNCTWSVVLPILAYAVLGQRLSKGALVGLAISYLGVMISISRGHFGMTPAYDLAGIALALGSTVIWSSYWLITANDHRDPLLALTTSLIASAPISAIMLVLSGGVTFTWTLLRGGLWVGAFELGFAYVFWLSAMRQTTDTASISQIALISPLISPLWITLVLGEPLHWASLLGLAFILLGLIAAQRR